MGRRVNEERGSARVAEACAPISMVDVLRHVEPCVVQVSEARSGDLTVSRDDEVLVVPVPDVNEGRALDRTGGREIVEVARRRRHAERNPFLGILEDDDPEVVRIRRGSPVVLRMSLIPAHGETNGSLREQVRREADPEPARGNPERRERVGAVAGGQEDARRYERPRAELAEASVRTHDEDGADVRVGRVDRPPGDRGSGRSCRHEPDDRQHSDKFEDASTHDSSGHRTNPPERMVGKRHKHWPSTMDPIRLHSNVQWSRSRNKSRNKWVAFPRSTRMRNAPRCLHISRPVARLVLKSTQSCSTRFSWRSIRTEYSFTRPASRVSVSLSTKTTDGSIAFADAKRFVPRKTCRSSSKVILSMSLFIGTSAWIVPASSSISPPLILTATPNRSSASLIFLSMYACSSGVYLARFRGSLKYRRAARAWNGVCTGYFQFAGSPYFSGSFGYPWGGPSRPSRFRVGFTARTIGPPENSVGLKVPRRANGGRHPAPPPPPPPP